MLLGRLQCGCLRGYAAVVGIGFIIMMLLLAFQWAH